MTGSNPIFANYFDKNQNEGNSLDATGTAEIRFLEDFKFTSANTVMLDETRFTYTNNPYYGQFAANNGSIQKAHVRTWAYNYQQLLNWHHLFDKHDVEVMLGHEYYRTRYYYLTASKNNVFSVFNDELAGAVNTGSMNSYTTDYNVEAGSDAFSTTMTTSTSDHFLIVVMLLHASTRITAGVTSGH